MQYARELVRVHPTRELVRASCSGSGCTTAHLHTARHDDNDYYNIFKAGTSLGSDSSSSIVSESSPGLRVLLGS